MNPSDPWAWVGLAGDLIDVAVPFVGGIGEATRAISATVEVIATVDDIHDASRVVDSVEDAADLAADTAKQINFYITPNGEAIPATLEGFNENLSMLNNLNGKYIGTDSNGPIRIRSNEIHPENPNFTGVASQYHTTPHFHIDRRVKGDTGDWVPTYVGSMEMLFK